MLNNYFPPVTLALNFAEQIYCPFVSELNSYSLLFTYTRYARDNILQPNLVLSQYLYCEIVTTFNIICLSTTSVKYEIIILIYHFILLLIIYLDFYFSIISTVNSNFTCLLDRHIYFWNLHEVRTIFTFTPYCIFQGFLNNVSKGKSVLPPLCVSIFVQSSFNNLLSTVDIIST